RNDAGRSEDVHEVLLLEAARPHELGQTLPGRGSLQSIVLLLEILDQHGQQLRQLFLSRRRIGLRVQGLKQTGVMLVFRVVSDDVREACDNQGPVLSSMPRFRADFSGQSLAARAHVRSYYPSQFTPQIAESPRKSRSR